MRNTNENAHETSWPIMHINPHTLYTAPSRGWIQRLVCSVPLTRLFFFVGWETTPTPKNGGESTWLSLQRGRGSVGGGVTVALSPSTKTTDNFLLSRAG